MCRQVTAPSELEQLHQSTFFSRRDLGESPCKLWAKRAFAVSLCVAGFFAIIVGTLAITASLGHMPAGIDVLISLAKIGIVNSAMIAAGGLILFGLGIAAWPGHRKFTHLGS